MLTSTITPTVLSDKQAMETTKRGLINRLTCAGYPQPLSDDTTTLSTVPGSPEVSDFTMIKYLRVAAGALILLGAGIWQAIKGTG